MSSTQDAEAKQDALNNQEKKYIEELKDAVYDANDVVDEFLTLVKRKNLTEASDKVTDKVRSFLSRFKLLTHHLSDKVKQVNKKLETIASNSSKFSFKVDSKPIRFSMEETSSFVPADNKIIGRDEDVEKIVGMLLDSNHVYQSDVSFLSIVGMGGLGKTALAQLVFNDPRIKSAFQLTRWTCIADQDHQLWNLTKLLGKVIMQKKPTSKEQIHREVRKQLGGKKYLLVLDDVWTECYHRWQEFEEFLKVGQSGSRIVVTTRSKKTAQMIGGDRVHELRGLSEEKSWSLFERMAFLPKQRETPNDDLLSLGKNIIKKCAHVPLAIKVVGSLLRGESKAKWKSFEEKGLTNMSEGDDTITNVLKLSYRQLDSSLKNCFAYCAIFPKGFEIRKIMLISLWMAQGYINNEYVGEEYFLMLLQRCFFQGVGEDEYGEIERFKIHDLLHDIAEQVAGEEICRLSTDTVNVSKRVRHLSLLCDRDTQESFNKTRIRTYLGVNNDPWSKGNADRVLAGKLVANWTCLRSLDLSRLGAEILPETIGKLFHLRYLNLSESTLKELPTSIAKLVNLQTLDLYRCTNLRELPNDVSKLVDLSTLDVTSSGLRHMPPGMGALTRLHTLGLFVAGRECSDGNECFDGLEDLSSLNNLKGYLEIRIRLCKNANYVKEGHGGGNYLKSKEHLKGICIDFTKGEEYGNKESEQLLLEEMQPHHGLKELSITRYRGETMPRWSGTKDKSALFHLPNLVSLQIYDCRELQCLPSLEKLSHLKELALARLPEVKYVVNVNLDVPGSSEGSPFFPCLEKLYIHKLPKLKGWWPRSKSGIHNEHLSWESSPRFAQLKSLNITDCPKMTSIPTCPSLESLNVEDSDRILKWGDMKRRGPKQLTISHLEWLDSMPAKYVQCLAKIVIQNEIRLQCLGEVRMLFQTRILSSLRNLLIERCPKLRCVEGWLEQISGLQSLRIDDCPNLLDGIPWQHLPQSLQSLSLVNFAELEELPEGISYCTTLQSLMIQDCPQLRSTPNWIPKLTCLQELRFLNCSQSLKERCQEPNGEDWPLIQHIPFFVIRDKLPKFSAFQFAGTSRSPMPLVGSVNLIYMHQFANLFRE